MMILRAVAIWLGLLVVASMNGALREALLIPRLGAGAGRAVSSVALSVLILLLTYATIRWIRPDTIKRAWLIGVLWIILTLAFEFLAGHFLFGNSWNSLLEDYNVARGRIWIVVLITTLIAPRIFIARKPRAV